MIIPVGARRSPLSKVQVEEVLEELRRHHPEVIFEPNYIDTLGDRDLASSLKSLEKTDFFTKEIDQLVLKGHCRVGIHSAKDLPDPLAEGLAVAAITQGVDPCDVLVMRDGESLQTLAPGSRIATSSLRREEVVKQMREDLMFVDIRGPIQTRINKLLKGGIDGLVVAEAALIRLGATHLNRVRLAGDTAPLQGQLAIVARADDPAMHAFFSCIDSR